MFYTLAQAMYNTRRVFEGEHMPKVMQLHSGSTCTILSLHCRARRTLILQADTGMAAEGQKPATCGRHNRCTRSADDIQLNRARVQQAAQAALTRSADWTAVSCIRKRAVSLLQHGMSAIHLHVLRCT